MSNLELDHLADEFEALHALGTPPELADFLQLVDLEAIPPLAALLIPIDIEYRLKRHDPVTSEEYECMVVGGKIVAEMALSQARAESWQPTRKLPQLEPLLSTPPTAIGPATTLQHRSEGAGHSIGPYRLLRVIGEGGMGEVWLAEQTDPIQRQVALKLIKAGLNNRQIGARFAAERQAIALMDHPHIAKLLDAGTTDSGAPFFVMEFVAGQTLTKYCDQNRLTIEQRLRLFADVCLAVQHAHQKGLIHRDLKPTNILVETRGGRPVPKIIDFGLAKAISGVRLSEQTLVTGFGMVLGTPLYMSPEQAASESQDIDTRADIYALGVILYELLTGSTPLTQETLKSADITEIIRLIRQQDAPTPSSRIQTQESSPVIAARRQLEPIRLRRLLQGELDWIVLKALAKERERRYESASRFAADIERFLRHEAVEAAPPSRAYQVKKFVRRYRMHVTAACLILVSLLVGIALSIHGLVQATRAAETERIARRNAESQQSIAEAARRAEQAAKELAEERQRAAVAAAKAEKQAREIAKDRLEQVERGMELLSTIFADLDVRRVREAGQTVESVIGERLLEADKQLAELSQGDPSTFHRTKYQLAATLFDLGYARESIQILEHVLQQRELAMPELNSETVEYRVTLASFYQGVRQLDRAISLFEQARAQLGDLITGNESIKIACMAGLGNAYRTNGQLENAEAELVAALEEATRFFGPEDQQTLAIRSNLVLTRQNLGQLDRSLVEFEQLLDDRQQWLGRDHPDTLNSLQNLAANYRLMGRLAEAEQKFREAYRLRQQVLGSHHPNTINSLNSLATTISAQARYAEANELFEKVLPARVERLGYEHPFTIATMLDLAEGYFRVQRFAEARPLVEQALSFALANLGEKHEMTLRAKASLGALDLQTQEYEKAIALLEDSLELYHRNPSYRWIQDQLLQAYIGDNRVESARKMLADHLTAARLHLSEIPADTLRLAEVLVQLSDAYRALHLWVDAEELLREAVGIRQQALPGSVELSHAQASLGSLVLQRALEVPSPEQNNRPLQEAEALLVSAYEIMEKQQPKTSEDLDKRDAVLADLIRLYEKSNRADEANRYREQTTKPLSASVGSESRNSTGN